MRKNLKRLISVASVLAMLVVGVARPTPTLAVDAEEGMVLAGAALAGYIVIVVVSTAVIYRHSLTPTGTSAVDWGRYDARSTSGLRMGPRCTQTGTSVTLACW